MESLRQVIEQERDGYMNRFVLDRMKIIQNEYQVILQPNQIVDDACGYGFGWQRLGMAQQGQRGFTHRMFFIRPILNPLAGCYPMGPEPGRVVIAFVQ